MRFEIFNDPIRTLNPLLQRITQFYEARIIEQYGELPVEYSAKEICPQLIELEQNFAVIRKEAEAVLAQREKIPKYHELDPSQRFVSNFRNPEKAWRVHMLNFMGKKFENNQRLCPKTSQLVNGIPRLVSAFFSVLDPKKSIPSHSAGYRAYLRYHLGLIVPAENAPTIRIKDIHYTWREGESFFFDDSWEHEVINHANEPRVILVVDIMRPLPAKFDWFISLQMMFGRFTYGRMLMERLKHF